MFFEERRMTSSGIRGGGDISLHLVSQSGAAGVRSPLPASLPATLHHEPETPAAKEVKKGRIYSGSARSARQQCMLLGGEDHSHPSPRPRGGQRRKAARGACPEAPHSGYNIRMMQPSSVRDRLRRRSPAPHHGGHAASKTTDRHRQEQRRRATKNPCRPPPRRRPRPGGASV